VSSGHKKISMEATTEGEVRTAVAIAARNAPSAQGRSPGARRQTSDNMKNLLRLQERGLEGTLIPHTTHRRRVWKA
jgi:hypothetical protein